MAGRVLVTGAASGLGAATVSVLKRRGWTVAGLDIAPSTRQCDVAVRADVTDEEAVNAAVGEVAERLVGLDAAVNAAGVLIDSVTPIGELDLETVARTLDVNLVGAFLVSRAVLPWLIESNGSIVLIASCAANAPQSGGAAYAMSKAGVLSLARSIALEYARFGVRANSVSPGYMDTPMAAPVMQSPTFRQSVEHSIPMGRAARPEEIAELVAWLSSDEASYLTGQDIVIDGGKILTPYSSTEYTERLWAHREATEEAR